MSSCCAIHLSLFCIPVGLLYHFWFCPEASCRGGRGLAQPLWYTLSLSACLHPLSWVVAAACQIRIVFLWRKPCLSVVGSIYCFQLQTCCYILSLFGVLFSLLYPFCFTLRLLAEVAEAWPAGLVYPVFVSVLALSFVGCCRGLSHICRFLAEEALPFCCWIPPNYHLLLYPILVWYTLCLVMPFLFYHEASCRGGRGLA